MLTAEGYLNYRQEPRVTVRDPWAVHIFHYDLREARELVAELQSAIEHAESLRRLADIAEDAHDSRKAEGM